MPDEQRKLPEFVPPTREEMRALWRAYPAEEVHRLILEIEHLRRVLVRAEGYRLVIARAYREQHIEQLIALENLRNLLREEKARTTEK